MNCQEHLTPTDVSTTVAAYFTCVELIIAINSA